MIALFLLQVFLRQLIQLFGQEDIVKGSGDIPQDRLLDEFQLVVGRFQADFGGPDGRVYPAEGIKNLTEADAGMRVSALRGRTD